MLELKVQKYKYSLKRKGIVVFETIKDFFIIDCLDGRIYKIPLGEAIKDGLKIQLQHPLSSYEVITN